jgi:hypothetical protein
MAQKKATVSADTKFVLRYDPDAKEFKDAIASYARYTANSNNEEEDVIEHIAWWLTRGVDVTKAIVGVGYVSLATNKEHIPEGKNWCGVDLENYIFGIDEKIVFEVKVKID